MYGNVRSDRRKDVTDTRPWRGHTIFTTVKSSGDKRGTGKDPSPSLPSLKCKVCNGAHAVYACQSFKDYDATQRFDAAQRNRQCFNCLKPGHNSKICRSTERCTANGCHQKHHTLLHKDTPTATGPVDVQVSPPNVRNGFVDAAVGCLATGVRHARVALSIEAESVRGLGTDKVVNTYALLDSGSTNFFCAECLLNELGIKGHESSISLTTLQGTSSESSTRVASLQVSGAHGNQAVNLPVVYARPNLPINHENSYLQ